MRVAKLIAGARSLGLPYYICTRIYFTRLVFVKEGGEGDVKLSPNLNPPSVFIESH